ncbi:hypothetical protein P168DRAFT_4861 [Aspergillus campestris IBT 28561]|uniref:Uncharacterized protein n=1 Tax=Aspergillus campestris (strain IBT 28561) TaxID=1392248 RepID=A0A2I1DDK6_ASPC2|nr:uncharacterized protein P168DRAFT_4861 [Aspergillus campestris IBT 28561]PKY07945.1 hypothetical protein P168DRAFT_4861 [Aspergillus campestris IBT 28561]
MQPNHYDLLGQVQEGSRPGGPVTRDVHHQNPLQSRPPSGVAPTRSEDSWIEVASQPSSSSLSSTGTSDDIITTGLRVEQDGSRPFHQHSRRRRLQHLAAITAAEVDYSSREASSSQEEYDESESESDRVLSSSNEEMPRRSLAVPSQPRSVPSSSPSDDAGPSSDEDDNSTALGMRISSSPFVPQPNVFSHPPATRDPSWTRPVDRHRSQPSDVSNCSRRTAIRRNSQTSSQSARRRSQQHSPYNMISPSYQADHDAALRASLSTLLSCAAAARGLPKPETQPTPTGPSSRGQPSSFRMVSESVAMGEEVVPQETPSGPETPGSAQAPRSVPQAQPVAPSSTKGKRRSSASKDRASIKKGRRTTPSEPTNSPTIMTWVISAGVVVLFSAISFSAGYVLGREVGRMEVTGVGSVMGDGSLASGRTSAACGQEAVRGGLKQFRWGSGTSGSGILA